MKNHDRRGKRRHLAVVALLGTQLAFAAPLGHAGTFGTGAWIAEESRAERVAAVRDVMAEQSVRDQLVAFGVDPAEASARVAALSDAELARLEAGIAKLHTGGDLVAIAGVVFVVLLILEVVGVTNVFTGV